MNCYWPFRKPEAETKSAWPLAALSEPRAASWGSREPGALIRDGYLKNAAAYRCVRMLAEAAASIPLKTGHEGPARLLRQPNPEIAPASFMEALYADLSLTGNAFAEAVRLPGELPLAALRPIRDARGWVEDVDLSGSISGA